MALTAGYEAVREASRRYESKHAAKMELLTRKCFCTLGARFGKQRLTWLLAANGGVDESSPLWRAGNEQAAEQKKGKMIKAALYGVQVFYSFFIM